MPGTGVQTPAAAPPLMPPAATTTQPQSGTVPFRQASIQKSLILQTTTPVMLTTSVQQGPYTVNGEGYIEELNIRLSAATAGNASNNIVAFTEDGRKASLFNVIFRGPGGDFVNVDGPTLGWYNDYDGKTMDPSQSSADVALTQAVASSAATGGSFVAWYRVPMAIGFRNLVGLLGNQDRTAKYNERRDLNASAQVYSTAPSTLPTVNITDYYTERVVPAAADNFGEAQQQLPASYGIIHYLMSEVAAVPPTTGKIFHYMTGLGNTWRRLILIFRQGTAGSQTRSAFEALANVNVTPMAIAIKLGDNTLYDEDYAYRRYIMYRRYGWDAPNGVLVYDWAADFGVHSGEELGDDFLNTQNVTNLVVIPTYPANTTATGNSLTVLKDTLYVPSQANLPALML